MSSAAFSGMSAVARSGRQSVGSVVPVQSCAEMRLPSSVRPQRPMPTTFVPDAATCFVHAATSTRLPRNVASSPLETTCPSVWFSLAVLSSRRWSEPAPECRSFVERSIAAKGSFGRVQRHDVAVGRPDASSHDSNEPFSKKLADASPAHVICGQRAKADTTTVKMAGKRGREMNNRCKPYMAPTISHRRDGRKRD